MLDLTIVIPVKNEEKNLPGCIASIGNDFASEIVIVDSGSSDRTKEIAIDNNLSVVDFSWNGQFPKKRNWYLRNHRPKTEWVLFIDADEHLTEEFKGELEQKLNEKNCIVGYWLNYSIYFMGKKLRGGYPLTKLALFKVDAGEYERIDEDRWSQLDMEIHEHPILTGEVGVVKNKIDHQDYRGIFHYINKHNEYASWEASRYLMDIKDINKTSKWTWKQKIKYKLLESFLIGPIYFIGSFFFMGGFKDGKIGFAFAIFKMSYFTQIYCKIKELKMQNNF